VAFTTAVSGLISDAQVPGLAPAVPGKGTTGVPGEGGTDGLDGEGVRGLDRLGIPGLDILVKGLDDPYRPDAAWRQ